MIISAAVQSRRGDQFLVDPLRSWEEVAGVEVAGVEVVRISGKEQHHFSWIALEAGKRVAVDTIQGMEGPLLFFLLCRVVIKVLLPCRLFRNGLWINY